MFDQLPRQILSLDRPPGTRMPERDLSRQRAVSRKPVRDAFCRPPWATVVSPLSGTAVMQIRFIRAALAAEPMRLASERLTDADISALDDLPDLRRHAVMACDG